MSTKQQALGNWKQVKGKVQEQWGQITDDELQEVEGQFDQLVGLIQQKSGKAKQEIERMVTKMSEESNDMMSQATNTAKQYMDQAGETIRGATNRVRERTMEGYDDARAMVRRHPSESVATAFGTGLAIGLFVGVVAMCSMQSNYRR